MISISNKAKSIVIGNEEFPKNTLSFLQKPETGYVQIKSATNHVIFDDIYSNYINGVTPYTSLASLVSDLSSFLFI